MSLTERAKHIYNRARGKTDNDDTRKDKDEELIRMIDRLKAESLDFITSGGDGGQSLRDEWMDSANRFVGNFRYGERAEDTAGSSEEGFRLYPAQVMNAKTAGMKRVFLMRTQNSTMANTASATASPVYGRLSPVEFGAEGVWYLTPRGGRIVDGAIKTEIDGALMQIDQQLQAAQQAEMQGLADPVQVAGDVGALTEQRSMVEQQVRERYGGLTVDQLQGENGPSEPLTEDQYDVLMEMAAAGLIALKKDDIVGVTDEFVSKQAQIVCDVITDRADMPIYWMMYALRSNITGWACGEFNWHTEGRFRHGITYDVVHPFNVFTDPSHWDMRYRGYHIEEKMIPVERLVVEWPDFADPLRDAASRGRREDGDNKVDYQRDMVVVTTAWVRDQLVPLSIEDAVADGKVVAEPVYDDQESMRPAYDEKTGEPIIQYFTPEGKQVEPQEDIGHGTGWPDGLGLRQVTFVRSANLVLQDIRCPYPEIPRVWSLNIPRGDDSPFGQGEPVRLKHVDELINYTLSMLATYLTSLSFPTCIWPKTLMARMRAAGVNLNTRPNLHIPMDDNKWSWLMQHGGFDAVRFKATPLPNDVKDFLQMLLDEHDIISGNVAVRQGREPTPGSSGKLVSELRKGAESSLSVKSRLLERSVTEFYRLLIHAISNWLPESEWAKILNRYELPVIREVIKRVRQTQWDVVVKVSSGQGQDEDYEQDKALMLYDRKLLSGEDALESLRYEDPQDTAKRAQQYWMGGGDVQQQAEQAAIAQQAGGAQPVQQGG